MAVDMFLKISDIKGESRDEHHKEWIEVASWSWGLSQSGTAGGGGGGGAGKVSVQDFSITKRLDKSSPKLMMACARGQHIKEATLHVARNRNDKQTYLEVKFTDLLVSSFAPGTTVDANGVSVTEALSLNFANIEISYREIDPSSNQVINVVTEKMGGDWNR